MRFNSLRRCVASLCFCGMLSGAAGLYLVIEGFFTVVQADMGEPCADCHEKMEHYLNSFHSRIWQGKQGCQDCHGPVDRHQDNPSPQTIFSFGKNSGRTADEMSGVCLQCHADSANLTNWDMGQHKANDVQCTACHTIHAGRSTVDQLTVCFGCHRETKAQVSKQSRHPVLEGKIKCSDCHNTHGTLSRGMINAETPNLLCYTCHVDKRGPFIWVHPPAEENCLICHTPHGSRHENLFAERIHVICQDCHDDSSHHAANTGPTPDIGYDATAAFGGANESNRFVARACVECHHTMHGSVNFIRSFTR